MKISDIKDRWMLSWLHSFPFETIKIFSPKAYPHIDILSHNDQIISCIFFVDPENVTYNNAFNCTDCWLKLNLI